MNIEQMFTQLFSVGMGLKPPVIVTDRYIKENYHLDQIFDGSSYIKNSGDINKYLTENIKILKLQECNLKNIPKWVFQLQNLEGLLLDRNPDLLIIPDDFKKFKKLKILGLMQTNISEFSFLFHLKLIESLDISTNNLEKFPEEICFLENLIYLDISTYNNFTYIPACIRKNANLRVLRAHYNKISSLPESLGELYSIEQIILGGNNIVDIPSSLYNLKNLTELDLHKNNIQNIDLEALSEIDNLNEIYLSGNPIENFPQELLSQNKGVLSSLSLRKYFSTGVYYEISNTRTNDILQLGRVLRAARALIIRGLFYGLQQEWESSYALVKSGYDLSRELNSNKLSILAGVFLGYLEVIKESTTELATEAYLKGFEWSKKIDSFWDPYEDSEYRRLCNIYLLKYSMLSQSDIGKQYKEEQDFDVLLKLIFDNNFEIIKIDNQDEITHSMLNEVSQNPLMPDRELTPRNDLNNRDLLRGYLEVGLFQEAWREVARQHCSNVDISPYSIGNSFPKEKNEIYLHIFQLTNRDKLRLLIINFFQDIALLEINSISISLNAISASLNGFGGVALPSEVNEKLFNNGKPVKDSIWDTIFGSYII